MSEQVDRVLTNPNIDLLVLPETSLDYFNSDFYKRKLIDKVVKKLLYWPVLHTLRLITKIKLNFIIHQFFIMIFHKIIFQRNTLNSILFHLGSTYHLLIL